MIASRFLAFAALVAVLAGASAQAADKQESRPVSGFTAVALSAPIKVELVQGATESLTLEGDERALAAIETVVENGSLQIRLRRESRLAPWNYKVRAQLGAKGIDALAIAGSGDITARSLRTASLRVSISGAGDLRIASLDASALDVSVGGSGNVEVAGRVDSLATQIAGSGDVRTGKLEARRARVSIAGSGDATVWAKEAIAVSVLGSGDVRYYGDPSLDKAIVGSGSVKRLGASPS